MKKTILIIVLMLVFSIISINVCAHTNNPPLKTNDSDDPHTNNPPLTPYDNH